MLFCFSLLPSCGIYKKEKIIIKGCTLAKSLSFFKIAPAIGLRTSHGQPTNYSTLDSVFISGELLAIEGASQGRTKISEDSLAFTKASPLLCRSTQFLLFFFLLHTTEGPVTYIAHVWPCNKPAEISVSSLLKSAETEGQNH